MNIDEIRKDIVDFLNNEHERSYRFFGVDRISEHSELAVPCLVWDFVIDNKLSSVLIRPDFTVYWDDMTIDGDEASWNKFSVHPLELNFINHREYLESGEVIANVNQRGFMIVKGEWKQVY